MGHCDDQFNLVLLFNKENRSSFLQEDRYFTRMEGVSGVSTETFSSAMRKWSEWGTLCFAASLFEKP